MCLPVFVSVSQVGIVIPAPVLVVPMCKRYQCKKHLNCSAPVWKIRPSVVHFPSTPESDDELIVKSK